MKLPHMRGVRVPHRKNTAGSRAVWMKNVKAVTIPLSMHIGAPDTPLVKVGDTVQVGQKIAEGGYMSSPIYASVSGTVKKIDTALMSNGYYIQNVTIESDGLLTPWDGLKPPVINDYSDFIAAVRDSGVVGLGGAGFPTAVKLNVKDLNQIEEFVINGAECEPYITSDTITMTYRTGYVEKGLEILKKYMQAKKIIIGIEDNKPDAIKAMQAITDKDPVCSVAVLKSSYPQGAEKVLIYNTTGKIVPEGKLPLDVGVVVMNVTSLACLAEYIETGMPLVNKCVTVDGSAVASPRNVIAPIGTPMQDVFDFADGFLEAPAKVVYGGPMMGIAVPDLQQPILKNTNAILAFNRAEGEMAKETPCIRCGRCVNTCPMRLNPPMIAKALRDRNYEGLAELKVNLCMECGACVFVCPAKRNMIQRHKLAKSELRSWQQKQAEQKKREEEAKAKEGESNG
ncbi:MAG: electron transport complex subunit RsxC [Oscillospiraceae bacterium]|nr:electron transport complex subunit RsxC [Oscillospiraceae bacterium]